MSRNSGRFGATVQDTNRSLLQRCAEAEQESGRTGAASEALQRQKASRVLKSSGERQQHALTADTFNIFASETLQQL